MMNNCTKYGFNNLIISGSYGGHRRHTPDAGRRTTPWVWYKLPTCEIKNSNNEYYFIKLISNTHSNTANKMPELYHPDEIFDISVGANVPYTSKSGTEC